MTATKSSLDKSPIVTPSYILYSTKRLWAVALLIIIALFFSTSVPLMIQMDNVFRNEMTVTAEVIKSRIEGIMNDLIVVSVIVSVFASFFTGCFALSFLHNKVSAGFHHSLPEKRSGHYIASLISSLVIFVAPLLINTFIVFLTFLTNGHMYGYVITLIWQLFFYSLFYYVVFLAVSFLAAMLSGTSAIHAIMSFYIVFVLPVIFVSNFLWIELGVTYLRNDPWDLLVDIGPCISPVFRIVRSITAITDDTVSSPIKYILLDTVITALTFYISYRLYKKRPIERAGTPIIYKPIGEIIKYSLMFPAALLMGYMFCEFGGVFWLIFGTAAGAVLSFMLMNTVLNRTAKAMFSGMKGFGVFCAVSIVLMITFSTGIFGYADYHVPTAKEITVNVDGEHYSLTSDEIREFRILMKEFNSGLRSGEINRAVEYNEYGEIITYENGSSLGIETIDPTLNDMIAKGENLMRLTSISVTYTNYFGISPTYRYNNFKYSDLADILAFIKESEANQASLIPDPDSFKFNDIYFTTVLPSAIVEEFRIFEGALQSELIGTAGYSISFNCYSYNNDVNGFSDSSNRRLIDFILSRTDDQTERPTVGYFNYNGYNDDDTPTYGTRGKYDYAYSDFYRAMPLYAEDIPVLLDILSDSTENCEIYINDRATNEHYYVSGEKASMIINALSKMALEDYISEQVSNIDYAIVINNTDKNVTKVADKNKLYELISYATQLAGESDLSSLTPTDHDYTVFFVYDEESFDNFAAYFYPERIPSFLD